MAEQFLHERYIQYKCKCSCEQHCGHSCSTDGCNCTECECAKCKEKEEKDKIVRGYN